MNFSEKTLTSKTVYDGKIFTVKSDTASLMDGTTVNREIICHSGGVGVLAIDENQDVILVKQFRYGAQAETIEIPAGKFEADESPIDCAKRELLEETGYITKNIISLGTILPTPAYCSEKIYIYFAKDLISSEQSLDEGEFLEIIKIPFDTAYEMVQNGEITDAKTVVAILKAKDLIN